MTVDVSIYPLIPVPDLGVPNLEGTCRAGYTTGMPRVTSLRQSLS